MERLNKKIRLSSIMAILILLSMGCSQDSSETLKASKKKSMKMAIVTVPNSALRIDPLIFSSRVAQMGKGELVEILEVSKEKKRIGKSKNYWYKIKLKNGITGWTFGSLLKVIKGSNPKNMEEYISEYWEKETDNLRKELKGKWWSVNKFGDFTNHSLEIYEDGKYVSYYKRSKKKIKGEYSFDFNSNSIVFSKGTSFGEDLNFIPRGAYYMLKKNTEKKNLTFKKINVNPQTEDEKEEERMKKEKTKKKGAKKG